MDGQRLLIVDDDELSREVTALIAAEAGFDAACAASGEDALSMLPDRPQPFAIVCDMQMPGICGDALARRLRAACGPQTLLLAMSGSPVAEDQRQGFDGFLLKPFSADDLRAACTREAVASDPANAFEAPILDLAVYEKFSRTLPPAQLAGLYRMCLDDARKRYAVMQAALKQGDDHAYRRAAHAIKGGCGMVGAMELAGLAAEMELRGVPESGSECRLQQFPAAAARLERMLGDKATGTEAAAVAQT
jgi:CheY-like chemotaxis protein